MRGTAAGVALLFMFYKKTKRKVLFLEYFNKKCV